METTSGRDEREGQDYEKVRGMKGKSPLRRLGCLEDSRFWRQLERLGEGAGNKRVHLLKSCVQEVAEQAVLISSRVCCFLPHFTLHDERHLRNVLAIMDAWLPDQTLDDLTPLECALPILAAYVHDLGLALPKEEWQRLHDPETETPERLLFLRHRDAYVHEQRQIEKWRRRGGADAERRIALIEGFILGEYVRRSHADTRAQRILQWLGEIEKEAGSSQLFHYGEEDYKQKLALIATSHGQDVDWLRSRLVELAGGHGRGFCQLVGLGEWVNWALPALLLRMADIMDFDASRAPRILYQHIGIENEASILEWEKHLSIIGWDLRVGPKDSRLIYRAECSHPIIEKTIRDFATQIEAELRRVSLELEEQRRWLEPEQCFELHLPGRVDLEIHSRMGPAGPLYIYQDLRLELDQSEIQSLLMGEALYGDPALCLRELVQNALDAVELRDLRLRLQKIQGSLPPSRREGVPADPLLAEQELTVNLSWGRDPASGEEWIRVRDHGVGMTRHVLGAYFTKVGRSFYRSPELARERAVLARHGLRLSSISCFGIGFLSCFMIADRIVVRTHPGSEAGAGEPLDITLLGPESLLWLRPGSLDQQGTEVTLFLAPEHPLRIDDSEDPGLDPAQLLPKIVVWPLYPVLLEPTGQRIGGRQLPHGLEAVDGERWIEKAVSWGAEGWEPEGIGWGCWEWCDDHGKGATGSRVRLLYPSFARQDSGPGEPTIELPMDSDFCRQDVLGALAEAELARRIPADQRTVVLVKGIRVEQDGPCRSRLPLHHGPGTLVWVDLHGAAAPGLTADRQSILEGPEAGAWEEALEATFARFRAALVEAIALRPGVLRNLLVGFRWAAPLTPGLQGLPAGVRRFDLLQASGLPWPASPVECLDWGLARWLQELALERDPGPVRDPGLLEALATDRGLDPQLGGRWRNFGGFPVEARALDRSFAREVHLPLLDLAAHRLLPRLGKDLAEVLRRRPRSRAWQEILEPCRVGWWLRHALGPRLERSSPLFGLSELCGRLADGVLEAPAVLRFTVESNGQTVVPPTGPRLPAALEAEGYDLVFPLGLFLGNGEDPDEGDQDNRDSVDDRGPLLTLLTAAPFLHPEAHDLWAHHVVELAGLFARRSIYALLPAPELWSKPFEEWSDEEKSSRCLSAFWDIEEGRIVWSMGRRADGRDQGRPFPMSAGAVQRGESAVLV